MLVYDLIYCYQKLERFMIFQITLDFKIAYIRLNFGNIL